MRREFPGPVKVQILKRAMQGTSSIFCEGCGLNVTGKKVHIDHTIPDAIARKADLTAEDGKLLGWDCCHKPKTAIDQGDIAKAKRRELKSLGLAKRTTFRKPPPGYGYDWATRRYIRLEKVR